MPDRSLLKACWKALRDGPLRLGDEMPQAGMPRGMPERQLAGLDPRY